MSNIRSSSADGWFIVQLSYVGEQQEDNIIIQELYERIGECEIFFPTHKEEVDGHWIKENVMPGYIFIKNSPEVKDPFVLETSRFFDGVVTVPSKRGKERKMELVKTSYIDHLRHKLKRLLNNNIEEGQEVIVTQGLYQNLVGKVTRVIDDTRVKVVIDLSSRSVEVDIPQVCLKVL